MSEELKVCWGCSDGYVKKDESFIKLKYAYIFDSKLSEHDIEQINDILRERDALLTELKSANKERAYLQQKLEIATEALKDIVDNTIGYGKDIAIEALKQLE